MNVCSLYVRVEKTMKVTRAHSWGCVHRIYSIMITEIFSFHFPGEASYMQDPSLYSVNPLCPMMATVTATGWTSQQAYKCC